MMTQSNNITNATQSFSFAYDNLNRRTTLTYPNNMQTTYTYDAKGNLIDIITQKALTTYKQTYEYDKTGNRTSYTEPAGIHTYTYDPTYQLVSADHTNIPDENYTYDPVGNRLTATVDNANKLIEDALYAYIYDNNGNLTQRKHKATQLATTYTYDYENRLIKINLPLGITAEYKYDPFGRRIEKNISNQITVKYLYDNEDIIMEYATAIPTNTTITTKYIHGPGIDEPLSMLRNNKTYYYHADALGSITRMTDQNGNTAQTIRYDSFGNIKSISNPLLIQPYAWTGREFDMESGFYYMRNRYYDPKTGRFISKDPIGFNGGDVNLFRYVDSVGKPHLPETNLYQYSGNNPINFIDPFGLFTWVNPITYWRDFFGGVGDFQDNYIKMVDANIIGADRYYHCMANCQASRRGLGGSDAAEAISEARELFDEYVKGDPRSVCDEDRVANRYGRKHNTGMPCATLCAPLIHPMWKPK